MVVSLGCIVEGVGEKEAVPLLIRRIGAELHPDLSVAVPVTLRIPKNKLVKPGELERAVELAGRRVGTPGGIFILLDADDDCPAQLGPALLQRASQTRRDIPMAVVIAKREFESWFLAAATSLRGYQGLPTTLSAPAEPETIRGAKEWLKNRMAVGYTYGETLDQPAFTSRFDLALARDADSFDKCYRDISRLILALYRE